MYSSQNTPFLTVEEIYSQFYFIFICSGIIMSIVVFIGIIGNAVTLVILCRKSLRSAPVCLLQCLTAHALVNMAYAVYSDVEPAIRSYMAATKMINNFHFPDLVVNLCDLGTAPNQSDTSIPVILPRRLYNTSNFFAKINVTTPCLDTSLILNSIGSRAEGLTNTTQRNWFGNLSFLEYLYPSNNSTYDGESFEMNPFIGKAFERFFAYSVVYFGLLVTLCLALERCIAVSIPLQASRLITVNRTRLSIVVIAVVCCVVHVPQLWKEIDGAINSPETLRPDTGDLLLASWRKNYEIFYAVSSLLLCAILFVINVIILRKLTHIPRKCVSFKHTRNRKHTEMNVTLSLVILIFCQLPLYIFINVVAFISTENYIQNFVLMTKLQTFIRLLYVTQSACNFLVYCVFARKFRKVLKEACNSLAGSSVVIGNYARKTEEVPLKSIITRHHISRKDSDSGSGFQTYSVSGCADLSDMPKDMI